LANGVQGFAYLQTITVTPAGSYTFAVTTGTLPTGLTLDANTGVISGTPTTTGTFTFTIGVTNPNTCPGSATFTIEIGSQSTLCSQSFDLIGAPALPSTWTTANSGALGPWATSLVNPDAGANAAYAMSQPAVGTTALITPSYIVMAGQMTFRTAFNLQDAGPGSSIGYDGMVLEISIDGAPFEDIVAAGGGFASGGYNKQISPGLSPIAGRMAWSGLSAGTPDVPGYITTTVNMPVSSYGHSVQLRWVLATDDSSTATGDASARIDTVLGSACQSTAAGVSIEGRVTTHFGNGIRNASVVMTEQDGTQHRVTTGSFGYYRFDDVRAGQTVVVNVVSQRFTFAQPVQVVSVIDNIADLDFTAEQ
jgi:hypothetical protein